MRNLLKMMILATSVGLASTGNAATPAPKPIAPTQAVSNVQIPAPETMLILIRSTVLALSQANASNNYEVLHALGSDTFQRANNPGSLAKSFDAFRANRIDMSPVALINPQLSKAPAIEQGRLHLVGSFPSAPMQVNFDLQFEPSQGQWKVFGIAVGLTQAPAQAPAQPKR